MRAMRRLAHLLAVVVLAAACGDSSPPFFVETLIAADTTDATGAYSVTTVVRDDRRVKWVRLQYQVGLTAAPITVELEPGEARDLWLGSIPGPGRETRIYYSLQASDEDGNLGRDPALAPDTYSFAVEPRPPLRPDAAYDDAAATDRHAEDAALEDGGREDAGAEDAGWADAHAEDTAPADAADLDGAPAEAATPDATAEDGAPLDSTSDA
jgi:hypothetical protein